MRKFKKNKIQKQKRRLLPTKNPEGFYEIKLHFFMKALPEPDLRYFSKLKAVYLLEKAKYEMRVKGNRSFVAGT